MRHVEVTLNAAANSPRGRRGTARRAMPGVRVRPQASARPGVVAHTATARRSLVGPLLIASEEVGPLGGALRLAEALARRDRVKAHVFSVARPLSPPLSRLVCQIAGLERHELEACRLQTRQARAQRRVHETVGFSTFFTTGVEPGEPVSVTADAARVRAAEYVLVALPGLSSPRRAGVEGAALRLAKTAGVPVLAVPAHVDRLPRSVLPAGVSRSPTSCRRWSSRPPTQEIGSRLAHGVWLTCSASWVTRSAWRAIWRCARSCSKAIPPEYCRSSLKTSTSPPSEHRRGGHSVGS